MAGRAGAAACATLFTFGMPAATAAPGTDGQGFVDSAARCTTPDVAVAFGSTTTSRVAICKTPAGSYQYRGVRVRDGADLMVPAKRSGSGAYVAENDGITYSFTPKALVISTGDEVVREEPMVEFHEPAPSGPTGTTGASTSDAPAPEATAPATPLPPPLPAEVGGGG